MRRFEKWPRGDSDAELAAHALIEGDATLAMTLYMARNPLVALAFSRSLTTGVATEQFNQAPRAMRESLIFPYMQGMEWATQLYKRGGWTTVSNAFTRLPLSSEQILHPEKYFNYERPTKVALPDFTSMLNDGTEPAVDIQQSSASTQQPDTTAEASPVRGRAKTASRVPSVPRPLSASPRPIHAAKSSMQPSSWRRIDTDINGEWSYYLILDQFLNTPTESKRAAAGWAGDRYAVYEGPRGQVFLAQLAVWDTENDAREFLDAYVKRTELRYPGAKRLEQSDLKLEIQTSERETRNIYSWATSEGRVVIELRGPRVIILEGIPEGLDASAFLKALSQ